MGSTFFSEGGFGNDWKAHVTPRRMMTLEVNQSWTKCAYNLTGRNHGLILPKYRATRVDEPKRLWRC